MCTFNCFFTFLAFYISDTIDMYNVQYLFIDRWCTPFQALFILQLFFLIFWQSAAKMSNASNPHRWYCEEWMNSFFVIANFPMMMMWISVLQHGVQDQSNRQETRITRINKLNCISVLSRLKSSLGRFLISDIICQGVQKPLKKDVIAIFVTRIIVRWMNGYSKTISRVNQRFWMHVRS